MTLRTLHECRIECDVRAAAFCREKMLVQHATGIDEAVERARSAGWVMASDGPDVSEGDCCPSCAAYRARNLYGDDLERKKQQACSLVAAIIGLGGERISTELALGLIDLGWTKETP